jgi:N-acetylneuraminate 9-O-acetyltransferase
MHASDIDAMNSDLFHRVSPPSNDYFHLFSSPMPPIPVALPLVFNQMLHPSQTEDGLHYSDAVVKAQANILLNLRCNDALPKRFPMDKTCCRKYPMPSALQVIILVLIILWGPCIWFLSGRSCVVQYDITKTDAWCGVGQPTSIQTTRHEQIPPLIFSAAIALIFTADRTGFWLKEQKQFNPWTFTFLSLFFLAVGLATVKREDKDLGFLNRHQTDEWKGWMQSRSFLSSIQARFMGLIASGIVAILIYHYLGASKVSGIYNPIRVLVASYLFMTGYGHTTYYIRKADFSFSRVARVRVSPSY